METRTWTTKSCNNKDRISSAIILPFPDKDKRPSKPQPSKDEETGTILFYMGVRYERMDDNKKSSQKGSRSVRRRRSS